MNIALITALRNQYAYPPVYLRYAIGPGSPALSAWGVSGFDTMGPTAATWNIVANRAAFSSLALDQYHRNLLYSATAADRALGVISATYWGYYADRSGQANGYAIARTSWVPNGKAGRAGTTAESLATIAQNATAALGAGSIGATWTTVLGISNVGPSFASKIVMFMSPEQCAVFDNVIQQSVAGSANPVLNRLEFTAASYVDWCSICQQGASILNRAHSTWTDWDGSVHPWRAVDVERAAFSYPNDPADLFTSIVRLAGGAVQVQ